MNRDILYITNYNGMSPFIKSLTRELVKSGFTVDILDTHEWYLYENGLKSKKLIYFKPRVRYLSYFLKRIYLLFSILRLNNYKIVVIFYFQDFIRHLSFLLKKISSKIIIYYAGSDFYRISNERRLAQINFINNCDLLMFNAHGMLNDFNNFYKTLVTTSKLVTGLGIDLLEVLNTKNSISEILTIKSKLEIPTENITISIGYNASEAQQHIKVLEKILSIVKTNDLFVILPMTYGGSDEYKKLVENYLYENEIENIVLKTFLTRDEIAEIRLISDITINMQTTDQASAALLEHLFSQNILLVGDWLPYSFWDANGYYHHKVNFSNMPAVLSNILMNFAVEKDNCKQNKQKVYDDWRWEKIISKHIEAFGFKK